MKTNDRHRPNHYEHISRTYTARFGDCSYPEILIYSVNFGGFSYPTCTSP